MVRPVADDDVWLDGALGGVVVGGQAWDVEVGENGLMVFQEASAQSLPKLVGIGSGGEIEEAVFQPAGAAGINERGQMCPPVRQTFGVRQEAFQTFIGVLEIVGRSLGEGLSLLADFALQMNQTLLLYTRELVVGAEEVADHDTFERVTQDVLGNFAPAAFIHVDVSPTVGDEAPQPVADAVDGPAGFVDMFDGRLLDGKLDPIGLQVQVVSQALEGFVDGAFRHGQAAEVLQEVFDLVARQGQMVFQPDHGGQGTGADVPVRHFIRSIEGCDHFVASPAPVTVMEETGDLHARRDDVFLDVLGRFNGLAQDVMTVWAGGQFLNDLAVDVRGLGSGDAGMTGLAAPPMGRQAGVIGSF